MRRKSDSKTKSQPAGVGEPEAQEIEYLRRVYVCSRCEAWFGVVYLHGKRWLCLACLREVAKAEGRSNLECWRARDCVATDCRDAGHLKRITGVPDRKANLIAKGLLSAHSLLRRRHHHPNCDWCAGAGCGECYG